MALKAIYWFLLTYLLPQISTGHAKVPAIIVFGDSSVDAGNNNQIPTVLKSNFPPYGRDLDGGHPTGRFSNGKIPTDFIAEAFGIKPSIPAFLDPSYNIKDFATGVCFASAGTGYDNATSDVLVSSTVTSDAIALSIIRRFNIAYGVITLWKEMEYYKEYQRDLIGYMGYYEANKILGEALYLISIGTNDFLENYYVFSHRSSEYSIEDYQSFLAGISSDFITELYQLGSRKISLGGLPPMGCLPLERTSNLLSGSNCIEKYNDVAKSFNYKLQELVEKLNGELVGIDVVFSNPYYVLLDIIQNPVAFGFDETAMACCGTGLFEMGYLCSRMSPLTCSNADQYVFWDAFHPTERTNGIVADHIFKTCLSQFL